MYVRVRARSLCCVVSADVTAGTALSRGVSKSWDSSSAEKRETDRSESIKLLSAVHSEYSTISFAADRVGRRREASWVREEETERGSRLFLEVVDRLSLVYYRGRRGGEDPRGWICQTTERQKLIYGRMPLR